MPEITLQFASRTLSLLREDQIAGALPLGFSVLAVGLLLWTGSLWAAVGVHGGFHVGNYIAVAAMPEVDAVSSWLAIGGVQAVNAVMLTVSALKRGNVIG